ncbi:5-hydroxyisourate hydrolase [Hasllibacter halocynthiae]|uniref:5-hydroxyisourate hydrolase n=1 Tax=Hasllibacter halocynthiae TaxID=595589 RepID=A0A2T0X9Z6_9RHOB|nr:hydroxyisourate hydrolase [Hasllibacter halocynthiae]PRY95770.1 5-hydroxyisourate hydrolase [Hasllibacter halocynthiae]
MPASLTTHVLDTAGGTPAKGMRIDLYRLDGEAREHLAEARTNDDGRTDAPILAEAAHGTYELVFRCADWLDAGQGASRRRFLGDVPIRFGIDEDAHYHVPLLLSPFGYSTYRGS